jgi:hypothetical protein
MANPLFVKDNRILWLKVPLVGTPDPWAAGVNYKIGDSIVPTNPPPELADSMFICCGFLGQSGDTQPTFPTTLTQTVVDNNILWKCQDPLVSPPALDKNSYYLIEETVTVS